MLCLSGFELYSRWVPLFWLYISVGMALKSYAACSVQIFNAVGQSFKKKKKKLVFGYPPSLVWTDYLSLSYAFQ